MDLRERATPGLHDAVSGILQGLHQEPGTACDLGAGSGAWSARLRALGYSVAACDLDGAQFQDSSRFIEADLNHRDFPRIIGSTFDLVTALEIIEHLESPIGFLRGIRSLLAPRGVAIISTPNVESLPARLKLLVHGRLRSFDSYEDPTHISPIFLDLFKRQYLKLSDLELVKSALYPPDGFVSGRRAYRRVLEPFGALLQAASLGGDNHVFVIRAKVADAEEVAPSASNERCRGTGP